MLPNSFKQFESRENGLVEIFTISVLLRVVLTNTERLVLEIPEGWASEQLRKIIFVRFWKDDANVARFEFPMNTQKIYEVILEVYLLSDTLTLLLEG